MLHVQKIGRGLRVNPGTEDCLILDHAGNSLRLGLVTDIQHDALRGGQKGEAADAKPKAEKLPKPCTACGALRIGAICPACGHEHKAVAKVETVAGDLVALTGKVKQPTRAEKQRFWAMALWIDNKRGKGGRLAKALYKDKFAVWPRDMSGEAMAPDQAFLNWEKSKRIAYAKRMEAQRGAA
jgi:hypothetical protein